MFHDDKLNELEKSAANRMRAYHAKLNKISHDIKSLESFLSKSGVMNGFVFPFGDDKFLEFFEGRIKYLDNNSQDNYSKNRDSRPLIEQKVDIRIECYAHLKDFMVECLKRLKIAEEKITVSL